MTQEMISVTQQPHQNHPHSSAHQAPVHSAHMKRVIRSLGRRLPYQCHPSPALCGISEDDVRRTPVFGNAFEPVAASINRGKIPPDYFAGDAIDHLGLSVPTAHDLFCKCKGESLTGAMLVERFAALNADTAQM